MEDLDAAIVRSVEDLPGLDILLLFGSRARGTARPDSDLDVGILTRSQDSNDRRYLQADVAVALAHLAPEGRVDVVLLDEANDVLRQRAMVEGRLLLCRDPIAWRDLRVRTMREYGDREWVRELDRKALRRRFEEGSDPGGLSGRSGRAVRSLERLGIVSR
jgi:predicted nucleotidyltransferase